MIIKCKDCGTKIEVDKSEYPVNKDVSTICPLCGETVHFIIPHPTAEPTIIAKKDVSTPTTFCPNCNLKVPFDSAFCPKCGYQFKSARPVFEQKDSHGSPLNEYQLTQEHKEHIQPYHEKPFSNLKLIIGMLVGFVVAIIVVIFLIFLLNNNKNQDSKPTDSVYSQETVSINPSATDNSYIAKKNEASNMSTVHQGSNTPEQMEEPAYSTNESRYDFACLRYVSDDDLIGLSKKELRIMRNWIYARHGYIFKSQDLLEYFGCMSWYYPRYSDVSSMLSEMEKENVYKIKSYE